MKMSNGLRDLIFPPRCLCCSELGNEICNACSLELKIRDYRTHAGKVPVFSSIKYGSKPGRILLAAKEDGVRRADQLISDALRNSLRTAIKTVGIRPTLIPVPHSKKALRKRGRNFVAEIAGHLAAQENLPIRQVIGHNRKVRDQSQLDAHSRKGNLSGSMSVVRPCGHPCEVFLIDDLITTGTTLGEAVRTLEKGGFRVVAAVTAFVALPLR